MEYNECEEYRCFIFTMFIIKIFTDISKWNTSNIDEMNSVFYGCSTLISLPNILKWNINNVIIIKGLFYECHLLKTLPDISKWNLNNAIDMIIYLFYECSSLSTLPDI